MRARNALAAALLCLLAASACRAELRVLGEFKVPRDKLVRLSADGADPKAGLLWKVYPSKGVDRATYCPRGKLEFVAPPGTYTVELTSVRLTADGNTEAESTEVEVTVGGTPVPPLPPVPPPGPTPDPAPTPTPEPAPIPASGFRVLVVYESAELAKLPAARSNVLFSKSLRDWLNSKCVVGPDGRTREWRIWDKDVATDAEAKHWQEAMKRPRKSVPWIVISNQGRGGYEGPLPENVEKTLELLKKYGGE